MSRPCPAQVTFAASVEVPAKVRFVHPTHNFAIIQYDPAVFRDAPEASKPTAALLDARELAVGDEFRFVGLCRTNPDQSLSQPVVVTEISCVNIAGAHVPRFRALNEEIAKFDQVLNKSLGGVLLDEATGAVVATWSRAGKGCEIPNFKGSYLGRFPFVSADFWTSDHLSERSRT